MQQIEQIEAAILALEAQRGNLGDAVVDTALAPLRAQLAALRAQAGTEPRLRQITVLFADIVGSTRLAERLDAEDVAQVVSNALGRFGAIVESHRGRVARYTGDGLKGIFGADGGEEDAAAQAVHAGLAIVADAQRFAETLRASHGVPDFRVRVGINTGLVALGAGIEADNTAMGATVNLAARLESAAPPGGVLMSQATHAHVRGMFEVVEQPPLVVRGHDEPLTTYVVERALPRAFRAPNRGVAGLRTQMVGRDAELARLLDAYDAAAREHALRAVTVFGEAGVGKSRLLHELRTRLDERGAAAPLLGRADQQLRLQPYGLLRDVLATRFAIAETDAADVARGKLLDGLQPALPTVDAELIGHLVGLDFSASARLKGALADARQVRDRAFRATVAWLRHLADGGAPAVLLLDDLHWADAGSLAWIRHVLGADALPLVVVMLSRPVLLEKEPDWTDGAFHARIDIAPLDAAATDALADQLLARLDGAEPAAHARLRDLVTRSAEGNPFYMEEVVQMLIDDGVIVVDGDRWRLAAERLGDVRVPGTLTAVLQARIDALAPPERGALQNAAVIGPVFWDAALDALAPGASAALPALQRRQFARSQVPSAFADCNEFAFVHHLLHQVAYDTVLKAVRRAGHARAAAWLSERVADRSGERLAATAEHFERAGDRAQAAQYFARAAQAAADRYENDAALEHIRRALENTEAGDAEGRFRMLRLRERVLDVLGHREAQRETIDEMEALCGPDAPLEWRAEVLLSRTLFADRCGDFRAAFAAAIETADVAVRAEKWGTAARAYGEQAYVLMQDGDVAGAREKCGTAIEYARRSGEVLAEAQLLAVLGLVEGRDNRLVECAASQLKSLELAAQHGHTRLEALMHGNVGSTLLDLGDVAAAKMHLEASLRMSREIGARSSEANAYGALTWVLLELGDAEGALENARQAVAMVRALNDRYFLDEWLVRLGDALVANGRLDEADAAYAESAAVRDGQRALLAESRRAQVALARGDLVAARRLVEPGLAAAPEELAVMDHSLRVRFDVWRVLAATKDPRAPEWLAAMHGDLMKEAVQMPEQAARERYLNGLAYRREIVAAFNARG